MSSSGQSKSSLLIYTISINFLFVQCFPSATVDCSFTIIGMFSTVISVSLYQYLTDFTRNNSLGSLSKTALPCSIHHSDLLWVLFRHHVGSRRSGCGFVAPPIKVGSCLPLPSAGNKKLVLYHVYETGTGIATWTIANCGWLFAMMGRYQNRESGKSQLKKMSGAICARRTDGPKLSSETKAVLFIIRDPINFKVIDCIRRL